MITIYKNSDTVLGGFIFDSFYVRVNAMTAISALFYQIGCINKHTSKLKHKITKNKDNKLVNAVR